MPSTSRLAALASLLLATAAPALAANTIIITSQTAGRSVFIEKLGIRMTGQSTLTSVQFVIAPKQDSFTRPLSATYSAAYMIARGYWDGSSPHLSIPVFGLYAGVANSVSLSFSFSDGTSTQQAVQITTGAYTDSCNALNSPISLTQSRTSTADLSFDYMLLKKYCSNDSPTIMDTDGEVRWVATDKVSALSSIVFNGAIYKSDGHTGVDEVQWDGTYRKLADYAKTNNVTSTNHHNFDLGKSGIVMDVNTTTETEAVDIEIDASGNVLNTWDLGAIISAAMVAGGDDPSKFTAPVGTDWFHNNATTYNPADNTLIVSSRENFVIAVDYDPPADGSQRKIHWIFGDNTKHWHQFQSLRKFALHPVNGTGTSPPIGQHGISLNSQGDLMLFDDGFASVYQQPPGRQRNYSAPRAFSLNLARTARSAQSTFSYNQQQSIYAAVCGSAYEDLSAPGNFLFDYPTAQNRTVTILIGRNANGVQVFNFRYPAVQTCGTTWNTQIVHLDNLQF